MRHLRISRLKDAYRKAKPMRTWRLSVWTFAGLLIAVSIASVYFKRGVVPPMWLIFLFLVMLTIRIVLLSGAGPEIKAIIRFVEFIEFRAPTGFIGILGFICLVFGFILQAWVNISFIRGVGG